MTDYTILKRDTTGEWWGEVRYERARSTRAAIAAAITDSNEAGDYVAIPTRSFRPVTVKVETKTALKFS